MIDSLEMADRTRSHDIKKIEETIRALKERQERSAKENEEIRNSLKDLGDIKEMLSAVTMKYDQMAAHVYGKHPLDSPQGEYESQLMGPGSSQFRAEGFQSQPPSGFGTRYAKVDFPRFFAFLVMIQMDGFTSVNDFLSLIQLITITK